MGGGAPSIPQRNLSSELNQLFKSGFPMTLKNYRGFVAGEPLLSGATNFALGNLQNIGSLIDPLQGMLKTIPGQIGNIAGQVGNVAGQYPGLVNELGALNNRLGGLYRNLPGVGQLTNPLQRLSNTQMGVYNREIMPVLNRGGALTNEQGRDVDQATRAAFAARGNVLGNQALGTELLNRDQYRRQRFNEALGQGLGLSGSVNSLNQGIQGLRTSNLQNRLGITQAQAGLTQGQGNLLGQQAGILGTQAGLLGSQAGVGTGLAQGIQGLQGGLLSQLLGTEQGGIGAYASLINPLLAYAGDLNSSNQNAAATQNIAGANKSSGLLGGGMSALGSIGGGIAMAL